MPKKDDFLIVPVGFEPKPGFYNPDLQNPAVVFAGSFYPWQILCQLCWKLHAISRQGKTANFMFMGERTDSARITFGIFSNNSRNSLTLNCWASSHAKNCNARSQVPHALDHGLKFRARDGDDD